MLVFELVFVCERLYGCSFILSVIFVIFKFFSWPVRVFVLRMCSVSALSSSGVTPAVSPVWGRAGGTAAAVPAVTACRMECVLLTPSAQTVSQASSFSITCLAHCCPINIIPP